MTVPSDRFVMIRPMFALALALLLGPAALAQPSFLSDAPVGALGTASLHPDDLFRWTISEPDDAADGSAERLRFEFSIEPGWKLYAMDSPAGRPLEIAFGELPEGVAVGGFEQSAPTEGYDPNFDAGVRYFEERAVVEARLDVAAAAETGAHAVGGEVTFMLCNDTMCLPPRTSPFEAEIALAPPALAEADEPGATAEAGEPAVAAAPEPVAEAAPLVPVEPVSPEPERTAEPGGAVAAATAPVTGGSGAGGLGAFLLLALGAGFAALLTPCVFPLIPLTVATFSKGDAAGEGASRGAAVGRALVFGVAVVAVFTALGGAASALLGAAGAQQVAANPWVNLTLGLAFVVFALALLGLIELRLPSRWVNAVDGASRTKRGTAGTVLAALAIALVSFSCTAPFVGGLLATAATGGWARPLLGMAVFSTAFALPFVALAAAPGVAARLPRSGPWMVTLKGVLGFVELAAALKFLSNADLVWGLGVLTRPMVIALTMAVTGLLALYLLGRLRLRYEAPAEGIGAGRLLGALAAIGAVLVLLPGLMGGRVPLFDAYLPPATGQVATTASDEPAWFTDDLDGARAEAATVGKPMFVDFTGYTCTNCRAMEANVFPAPEVAPVLAGDFVRARLYTDAKPHGPTFQQIQQEMTGTIAMPTYAVVSPEGEVLGVWSGMASPEDFAAFLREAASRST